MKSLLLPAVLLLLANTAAADSPDMQEGLQKILNDRSAELDRSFAVKLDQLIEISILDSAAVLEGKSGEAIRKDLIVGDLPLYFAWHSAR
jgi:hypothetical protein